MMILPCIEEEYITYMQEKEQTTSQKNKIKTVKFSNQVRGNVILKDQNLSVKVEVALFQNLCKLCSSISTVTPQTEAPEQDQSKTQHCRILTKSQERRNDLCLMN